MEFESFKKEILEKGSNHITTSLKTLEDTDKPNVFLISREQFRVQLGTICNDILISYGSLINPKMKFDHQTMDRPIKAVELLGLHYSTVCFPLFEEFNHKADELFLLKYPNYLEEDGSEVQPD